MSGLVDACMDGTSQYRAIFADIKEFETTNSKGLAKTGR
jgi:hypothetical protein